MTMPNFLIPGAAKSGTTSLFSYLAQHPQVFVSRPKEPKFFAYEGQTIRYNGPGDMENNSLTTGSLTQYESLFAKIPPGKKAIGEASALYLYVPEACERIKHY